MIVVIAKHYNYKFLCLSFVLVRRDSSEDDSSTLPFGESFIKNYSLIISLSVYIVGFWYVQ